MVVSDLLQMQEKSSWKHLIVPLFSGPITFVPGQLPYFLVKQMVSMISFLLLLYVGPLHFQIYPSSCPAISLTHNTQDFCISSPETMGKYTFNDMHNMMYLTKLNKVGGN